MLWDVSWDQNNVIGGQRYSEYAFQELGEVTVPPIQGTTPPVSSQSPHVPITTQVTPAPVTTQAPPLTTTGEPPKPTGRLKEPILKEFIADERSTSNLLAMHECLSHLIHFLKCVVNSGVFFCNYFITTGML